MDTNRTQLSQPAWKKLSSARSQRNLFQWGSLILAIIASVLVLAGVAMLLDWVFSLRPVALRIFVSLGILVAILKAGHWLWKKLSIDSGVSGTAQWLDEVNPSLEERVSTTVELSDQTGHSSELLNHVSDQVDEIGIEGGTSHLLSGNIFRNTLIGFGVGVVTILVLQVASGPSFPVLLARLVQPWSDTTLTTLPAEPEPVFHRKGEDFDISIPVAGKIPSRAKLQQRAADGTVEERWVKIDKGSGKIDSQIPRVKDDFAYRVIAGDDQTPWNEVKVMEKPKIQDLALKVIPPAYTGMPTKTWNELPRRFKAPEGSEIRLTFGSDQPLAESTIVVKQGSREDIQPLLADNEQLGFETKLDKSLSAEIQLTTSEERGGLTSRFPIAMTAQPDQKPKVQLLKETENFALKADETLDIRFGATDDYGIQNAEVVAELQKPDGSKEEFRFPVDLGSQVGEKNLTAAHQLDLKQIPIEKGSRLNYSVEVTDNRGALSRNPSQGIALEDEELKNQIAQLENAIEQVRTLKDTLQNAQTSNTQALQATRTIPSQDGTESGKPRTGTPAAQQDQDNPNQEGNQDAENNSKLAGSPAPQQNSSNPDQTGDPGSVDPGTVDPGQESSGQISKETQKLLNEAAELTASLSNGVEKPWKPVSDNVSEAQDAVASAQTSPSPSKALTQAGESIAQAQAALEELNEQIENALAEATAQQQLREQLASLNDSLLLAQAMTSQARQMNQAGGQYQAGGQNQAGG
ncbi:MAG: hypothetical protein P1U85_00510, partial [Verrucomicrobiales bacterium]|nr:hypothetical protein [Verrucomicrobiales bacterium]